MIHALRKIPRGLAVSLCVWSLLVSAAGCGAKAKVVVAGASEPASPGSAGVQQYEPVRLQGEPVAAVLMQIDQEVITTDDVLTALAEPLKELAGRESGDRFRQGAEMLTRQHLRQRMGETLLLNDAKNSLSDNENSQLEAQVQAYKEQLLRECDQSPTWLEKTMREKGTTLKEELDRFKRDLQVRIFLSREFSSRINISREDIVAYYNRHQQEYNTPRKVDLLQIVVLNHKHAEPGQTLQEVQEQTRQIAQQAWDELARGKSFGEVAQKYSDLRREQGGSWPNVDPSSLEDPLVRRAGETLAVGQFSEVIETEFGYCIVGIAKIVPAEQKSLEQVQEQIQQSLWNIEYDRLYNQRVTELTKRAVITVSPTAMGLVVDLAEQRFGRLRPGK